MLIRLQLDGDDCAVFGFSARPMKILGQVKGLAAPGSVVTVERILARGRAA